MARIRNIKPEFFRHEELQSFGALPMLVFTGLWCQADREGRFNWKPKTLKLDILPFIEFNMGEVLDQLLSIDLIRKYSVSGADYGLIKNWSRHQLPGRDEPPSEIPALDGVLTDYDRPPNATIRAKIYERDGYSCSYCKIDLRNSIRSRCIDHVIPYAKGGKNTEKNLVTSCKQCNYKKGNKTPLEAKMPWPDGFGEQYVNGVLTVTLTDLQPNRDKEREKGIENGVRIKDKAEIGPWFSDPLFSEAWSEWTKARKSKPPEAAYRKLVRISGSDLTLAIKILNESAENGWTGIFPLKGQNGTHFKSRGQKLDDAAESLLRDLGGTPEGGRSPA